ncbi:MAG TPA: hypothetical protein VMP01_15255 [Pirellulaceae bacterium]|nr:hypothetical protein [Pirellulaceae bacterium]
MSTETPPTRSLASLAVPLGPRGGIVVLVAAHFVLAILQTWSVPMNWQGPSFWWIGDLLVHALEAIPLAQLTLIAAFITLGSGRWLARIVRGLLLLLWLELAHMIGTRWLAGGRDAAGFEEFLGQNLWHLAFLTLPLLLYRLIARRKLVIPGTLERPRFQFRIVHLLLITTEAAALLAAIRAFVVENREWRDQLWRSIRDYLFDFASYDLLALVILCAIPAVLVTLRWRSIWKAAVVLAAWQLLLSTGFVVYRILLPELDPQFPIVNPAEPGWMWGIVWLSIAATCASIACVIWLTLAIVRWLGYDFLPVRRGGRQSSEATSAA